MPAIDQDQYAATLLEQLSDLVDTLNEARADGTIFQFQIESRENKFVLTSLVANTPVAIPNAAAPQAPNVN